MGMESGRNELANPHSHTHCQAARVNAKPKLGKECICPNARQNRQKTE